MCLLVVSLLFATTIIHSSAVSFHPSSYSITCGYELGVLTLVFSQLITRDSTLFVRVCFVYVIYFDLRFRNSFFYPTSMSSSIFISSSSSYRYIIIIHTFFMATLTLTTTAAGSFTCVRGTDFGTLGADLGDVISSTLFSFYFFDSSMAFLGSYLVRFWRFSASFGSLFLPFTFFTYSSTYTSYSSSSIYLGVYFTPPIGISSQLG